MEKKALVYRPVLLTLFASLLIFGGFVGVMLLLMYIFGNTSNIKVSGQNVTSTVGIHILIIVTIFSALISGVSGIAILKKWSWARKTTMVSLFCFWSQPIQAIIVVPSTPMALVLVQIIFMTFYSRKMKMKNN